jgi:nucleoside-diphosphate-sugar epimerase
MRVVVVGGTGNISLGVVKSLLDFGHEVTVFNRGETDLKAGGIADEALPDGVRVLCGDRKDREAFEATMRAEKFDAAIDMICFDAADAESDVRAFAGIRQFVNISSVATLGGEPAALPMAAETPRRPGDDYARGKAAADEVLSAAHANGTLPLTVFMPAQTWGRQPRILRQLGFESTWIDRIRKGLPILVAHDGQLIWSHCHADDTGLGIAGAVGRDRCIGQTYIITRFEVATWRDYHEQIASAVGKPAIFVDAPADLLIAAWPEGTGLLARESRWNRLYDTGPIRRDIPEFQPRTSLADVAPAMIRRLDQLELIPDARSDPAEDRIIKSLDRLARELATGASAPTSA